MRTPILPVERLRGAALSYSSTLGWAVFPLHSAAGGRCTCGNETCERVAKHPLARLAPHGLKDATTDKATIERWWSQEPDANIAIATGSISGAIVLDVDPRHGGDASLKALEVEHGQLPTTVKARTGGGGFHYFFAANGVEVRNTTNLAGYKGLDVRGEGGYVVAPPSDHRDGGTYEWINPPGLTPLATVPAWLSTLMTSGRPRTNGDRVGDVQGNDAWLTLLQGTPEGERHHVAARIAGHFLGLGRRAEEVEALLIGYAARCTPPHDFKDVRQIVRDLAAADEARAAARTSTTRIDTDPWPTLSNVALYGLPGDIVRTIEPHSEADPVALLVNVLVAFGNLIGPGPHFVHEETEHPCRVFAALVGQTAGGRKGTSWSTPRKIFKAIDPNWNVTGGLSSGEGVIYNVRDERRERKPQRHGENVTYREVIVDHGVTDKRLMLVEQEFPQALKVSAREGNILSPILRQAWDSGDLHPLTKTNPIRATGAHISIIGHITRDELIRLLTETDQANGFANRFLWVLVKRSKKLPRGGSVPRGDLDRLIARLRRVVERARFVREIRRTIDAEAYWAHLYAELSEGKPGLLGAILARAEPQVMRLAMVYALMDDSRLERGERRIIAGGDHSGGVLAIRRPHLEAALALWRYAEASARWIFGSRLGDPIADKILRLIRTVGELTETQIHDAFSRHLSAGRLAEALDLLHRLGFVTPNIRTTGGRPQTIWTLSREKSEETSLPPDDRTKGDREESEQSEEKPDGGDVDPDLSSHSSLNSHPGQESSQRVPRTPAPPDAHVPRQPIRVEDLARR